MSDLSQIFKDTQEAARQLKRMMMVKCVPGNGSTRCYFILKFNSLGPQASTVLCVQLPCFSLQGVSLNLEVAAILHITQICTRINILRDNPQPMKERSTNGQ